MKKLKLFASVASLVLLTAAVLAGKSKMTDAYRIYGYNSYSGFLPANCNNILLCSGCILGVGLNDEEPAVLSWETVSYTLYYYDTNTGLSLPIIIH